MAKQPKAIERAFRSGLSKGRAAAKKGVQARMGTLVRTSAALGYGIVERQVNIQAPAGVDMAIWAGTTGLVASLIFPRFFTGKAAIVGDIVDAVSCIAGYKVGAGQAFPPGGVSGMDPYTVSDEDDEPEEEEVRGQYTDVYEPTT